MSASVLRSLLLFLVFSLPTTAWAQFRLQEGTYLSADGQQETQIKNNADGSITLTVPRRVNRYVRQSGNVYHHSEFSEFLIRLTSTSSYTSYSTSNPKEFEFTLQNASPAAPRSVAEHGQWQQLYEKYQGMAARATGDEVQAWSFCAAVAYTRAHLANNQQVTDGYIEPIIVGLKQILVDAQTCPCTDVIPADMWQRFNP